jgi:hypothetical protein
MALLVAGCATGSEPSKTLSLTSTEWRLLKFVSSDDAIGAITPRPGEEYTLILNPDGSLAAGLFCNRGTGRWTSPDAHKDMGSITLELKAATTAACPDSSLNRLQTDLAHVRSFVIRDGQLHLNLKLDSGDYVWAPK